MNVSRLTVSVYRIPTDRPEADGTFAWDSTTMVRVEVEAESGLGGFGFTYAAPAAATLIRDSLAAQVIGTPVTDVGAAWQKMIRAVRNSGRPGIAATAISAVDIALWDLKARALDLPLFRLLNARRVEVPLYGSGGFTSYTEAELAEQLAGWVAQGIPRVKMKLGKDGGTRPEEDVARVRAARQAIGPEAELMVDANGAYSPRQAIEQARRFAEHGVTYFEEPVTFDHPAQLAFVREHASMAIASGEYGYDRYNFRDLLTAGAVDILQADATRCLGVTGCLAAADLAFAFGVPFSTHTAASIHAHVACAAPQIEHVEYFHDHARIERMLFDGAPEPKGGVLRPDPARLGLGLEFKRRDAERYAI